MRGPIRKLVSAASLCLSFACGSAPAMRTLGDTDARDHVMATCAASGASAEACTLCALGTLDALLRQELITDHQYDLLRAEFAAGSACRGACFPTTCVAAARGCGEFPDGCGRALTCGSACGSRAWCILRDALARSGALPRRTDPDAALGYAKVAISDEGAPACAEEGAATETAIAPLRARCDAVRDELLALYCGASTATPEDVEAVLYWEAGCWASLTTTSVAGAPLSCD